MCQGQPGKIPCLSPEKMTIFSPLALLFHLSLPKIWHTHPLRNYFFEKYKNRTIITQRVILTPSNLWFMGAFESYLFFIRIWTIISENNQLQGIISTFITKFGTIQLFIISLAIPLLCSIHLVPTSKIGLYGNEVHLCLV